MGVAFRTFIFKTVEVKCSVYFTASKNIIKLL